MNLTRVANKLKSLEDEVYQLYENVPFGSHTLDASGTYIQVNSRELYWLGYNRQEIIGNAKFVDFLTPASQELFLKYTPIGQPYSVIVDLELELVRRDGTSMPVALNTFEFAGESAGMVQCRAVVFDLRERKLNATNQQLAATAFESLSGMFITNSHKIILRVNRAYTELTGFSAEDVVGETPHVFSADQEDAPHYQTMWASLNQHGHWQGEVTDKRKDGIIFPEFLSITNVIDLDGDVTHYIGSFMDISSSKADQAQLTELAYFDPLTKLANRRLLLDRITNALIKSKRNRLHGAIFFVDLDHFKVINDTRGHDAGDAVLVEAARRLQGAIRACDSVARLGGDEFVVLLEGLDLYALESAAQARQVAEKILVSLAQPYQLGVFKFYCTASIGIELFVDAVSASDMLQHADMAMYKSKGAGRNSLCFFDPAMQLQVDALAVLEDDLRRALDLSQFRLFFQPQVDLQGKVVAAEALLRWQHPQRGLVSPGDFIDLAEATDLIIPIGLWVLRTACAQLKEWESRSATRHLHLAVNVSARQYRQDNFLVNVREILTASAIDPTKLVLEVTESMILDIPDAIGKMNSLKTLGVRFSMDDFGTGYSSLSSLMKLPLSELKIDQSFVGELDIDPTAAVIVRATIALGLALQLEVVAEGVETMVQREMLVKKGCRRFQGYLFSRPVNIRAFEALV